MTSHRKKVIRSLELYSKQRNITRIGGKEGIPSADVIDNVIDIPQNHISEWIRNGWARENNTIPFLEYDKDLGFKYIGDKMQYSITEEGWFVIRKDRRWNIFMWLISMLVCIIIPLIIAIYFQN